MKERKEVDKSAYLFSFLENGKGWDVDAERFGNEMRFINDYRGIAATPNAKFNVCTDPRTKTRGVQVIAISNISNGGDSEWTVTHSVKADWTACLVRGTCRSSA